MTRWTLGAVVWLTTMAATAAGQGLDPQQAAARMSVPDGFRAEVVAAEPLVRQPVAIEFDDRGRLWTIQYLQYPNPAGLKRVQVDRYSRTKYDRVPEPPPKGPRGADRITILEDVDGDGVMDRGRDFVDGLNLATGLAFGHGGVFVLNVPYLLFYPDRNRDDVPDSDPEVLLSGFGMEDAHSVANSLTWGPDGWLYGCQGSTVTADVRGIQFQQGVWRYHPVEKKFELFCEGGGNSWGLDFDRTGRLLYSTNYGGHVLLHGVQGGYFVKSFGKHGELHNPHAYGYFDHAPHQNFQGGHVTVGGIVYQGDAFPEAFRGAYIGGDLLGHGVYWHAIRPRGSTVRTEHAGRLLVANDAWFAPTDLTLGPDGAIYVSDWHDARTAHPDPDADWDRTNGRIYRITTVGARAAEPIDFARLPTDHVVKRLDHPSQWHVRKARQELVRRFSMEACRDEAVERERRELVEALSRAAVERPDETAALESLWTVHVLRGFDERLALRLLDSPHPAVRAWSVRLLGDSGNVTDETAHRLDEFAEREPAVEVRQQIACSAARLPARHALPMINAHINRDIDLDDPYLPLLWWWAVERHSVEGRAEVMKRFVRPTLWKSRLGRDVLLPRLVRRYAAEGTEAGLDSLVALLQAAPDPAARQALWPAVLAGWAGRPADAFDAARHPFAGRLANDWSDSPDRLELLQLGVAVGLPEPLDAARRIAFDSNADAARRTTLLERLAARRDPSLVPLLLDLAGSSEPLAVRQAAVQALGRLEDARIAPRLIALHRAAAPDALRSSIRDTLLGRASTARAWVEAVDRGELPASATPLDQIRRAALFADPQLDSLVAKHWGKLQGATREEKLAEVRRLNNDLRAGTGDAATGAALFKKHCANCHLLFGDGAKIGPDLTTANRQDRDFLLVSLVDPSSVIRKEYVSVVLETKGGRLFTGLPVERTDSSVTLINAKNEKQTVSTAEIETLEDSPVSLMPDDLYRQFKPQELRDLFAYLQQRR